MLKKPYGNVVILSYIMWFAKGDYFGMNSENIEIDGLNLSENYCFDGGKNITVRNSKLVSKDAFGIVKMSRFMIQ